MVAAAYSVLIVLSGFAERVVTQSDLPLCLVLPADINDWKSADLLFSRAVVLREGRLTVLHYALQVSPPLLPNGPRTLTVTPIFGFSDGGDDHRSLPCTPNVSASWSCGAQDGGATTFSSVIVCEQRSVPPAPEPPPGKYVSENPPQSWHPLRSVWGSTSNDVWAVGALGTVVHYDGTLWSAVDAGTSADLDAIAGSSANDVWAVGANGANNHWDGRRWESRPAAGAGELDLLAVPAADEVWAGSSTDSQLLRWQRGAWWAVDAGVRASRLFAPKPRDLWVFDDQGACSRFDGRAWRRAVAPLATRVLALTRVSPRHFVAAGESGALARFDGELWWRERTAASMDIVQLWFPERDTGWAFGARGRWFRWGDAGWMDVWAPPEIRGVRAVWGAAANDGWLIDSRGALFHYDGGSWSGQQGAAPVVERVRAVAELQGSTWAAGSGVMQTTQAGWAPVPAPGREAVNSVTGTTATDVWAATYASTDQDDGAATLWHYDGARWTADTSAPKTLRVVWQGSAGELWAAGDREAVWRQWRGAWSEIDRGTAQSFAFGKFRAYVIASDGAGGVWVAGNGPIKRCTPARCISFDSPILGSAVFPFVSLTALSPTLAYAVVGDPELESGAEDADDAVIAQWDGSRWTPVELGPLPILLGHVAIGPGDLWVLGADNSVIHLRDGKVDRARPHDVGRLTHITRSNDGTLRLIGEGGRVLRWIP